MISAPSLPPGVEVQPAAAGEEPVLANLLELYSHDFSEFTDVQLQPDGRFGYPPLPLYWREEGRFPFLVRVDGYLAGLALVASGSRISGDPEVRDMAEFFIARRHRKRGIGAAVAQEIFRRFPGPWEVRVLESNPPARAFWEAVIGAFTGSPAGGTLTELEEKRWQVYSFVSPAPLPEAWLRGPLAGVPPALQPAAHALLQALEDVERLALPLSREELWATPGGAAPVGFHLRHLAGSLERLLTYARGEALSEAQRAALAREKQPTPEVAAAELVEEVRSGITRALEQLRMTPEDALDEPRAVGRAQLPSSVRGLLHHAAEHTARHAGQISTTVKVIRGLNTTA